MKHEELIGKAQTVLGPVDGDALGITLPHEHLLNDHSGYFRESEVEIEKQQAWKPVQLENLYLIRLNPFCNRDNLVHNDVQLSIKEALIFKSFGGKTIVDVTTDSAIGRDPQGLAEIARKTGLNIIMGAGFYTADFQPPEIATQTEEQITDGLVREITEGVGDTGIKAGLLGEIGCNTPLAEGERKVLRCCAAAQRQTGVTISIHPGAGDETALEIVRVLKEAGADLRRVIIGHVDLLNYKTETRRRIMDDGCYIAFDNIGHEGFFQIPLIPGYFELADVISVDKIVELVRAGYLEQILVSHDIATKERLTSYAGTGYAHILRDVIPIMKAKGLSDTQINTLLLDNPRRAICIA